MNLLRRLLLCSTALSLSVGCATTAPALSLQAYVPTEIAVPRARQLALIEATGDPEPVAQVFAFLQSEAKDGRYYTVVDRTYDGFSVELEHDWATLRSEEEATQLRNTEAGLRLDVETRSEDVKIGRPLMGWQWALRAHVTLKAALFRPDGTPIMVNVLATGSCDGRYPDPAPIVLDSEEPAPIEGPPPDLESLTRCASKKAAQAFLKKVTPSSYHQVVRLSSGDKGQRDILQRVRDGDLTAALEEAVQYRIANPENHVAIYNLAVILDALGRYEAALPLYDEAIALTPNAQPHYRTARLGCDTRLKAERALTDGVKVVVGAG